MLHNKPFFWWYILSVCITSEDNVLYLKSDFLKKNLGLLGNFFSTGAIGITLNVFAVILITALLYIWFSHMNQFGKTDDLLKKSIIEVVCVNCGLAII